MIRWRRGQGYPSRGAPVDPLPPPPAGPGPGADWEGSSPLGYWVIAGESILDMLREVADGGDPDMVYAAHYACGQHEYPEDRP